MCIVFVAIVSAFVIFLYVKNQPNMGKFFLADYQWEIEHFPSDKNVGSITDENDAIKKARILWLDEYSAVNGQSYDPIKKRKIKVYFDHEQDCWLVTTTVPLNTKASVPHALIQSDGTVLAIWLG